MINALEVRNKNINSVIKAIEKDLKEVKVIDDKMLKDDVKKKNDWNNIMKEIKNRENDTCAICFSNMINKRIYVTSCTHCFHKNCLESFEKYDHVLDNRCPICRSNYEKIEIILKP
jgi:hypothetical protein